MEKVEQAVEKAIRLYPELTNQGFILPKGLSNARHKVLVDGQSNLFSCPEQYDHCCKWLHLIQNNGDVSTKNNSYGYKHKVEDYIKAKYPHKESYISNGMFIVAAIDMGFDHRPKLGSTNMYFNICQQSVENLTKYLKKDHKDIIQYPDA